MTGENVGDATPGSLLDLRVGIDEGDGQPRREPPATEDFPTPIMPTSTIERRPSPARTTIVPAGGAGVIL